MYKRQDPNGKPVTVTYEYGKLDGIYAKQIVQAGEKAIEPDVPSRQGYQFTDWYLDDTKYDFNATVTKDMTLTAQWTLDRYTISYNLNNGTATGNPDSYTVESDAITLNTPTRPGYTFTGWSGTGLTGENNLTVTIEKGSTGNRTYTAHWRYNGGGGSSSSPSYPVSVPDKTDHGSVTVSPKNASAGSTVTITVKPDSGYVLETISVTDKNGNDLKLTDKGNGKYTFTMPGYPVTVEAKYEKIPRPVTFTAPEHGTLALKANGAELTSGAKLAPGTEVTITAVPAEGYQMVSGYPKAYRTDAPATAVTLTPLSDNYNVYTFTMPDYAVTVEMRYEKIPYAVSFATPEHGKLALDTAGIPLAFGAELAPDTRVTLAATPDAGYQMVFGSLKVSGSEAKTVPLQKEADGTTYFLMPASEVNVEVEFEEVPNCLLYTSPSPRD